MPSKTDAKKTAKPVILPIGNVMPLLPLRDIVLFPHEVRPLYVGREKSVAALKTVMAQKMPDKDTHPAIIVTAQKKAKTNDPTPDDLFHVGTIAKVVQLISLPDGTMKALVEGTKRVLLRKFIADKPHYVCVYERIEDPVMAPDALESVVRAVHNCFTVYADLNKRIAPEIQQQVCALTDASRLADTVAVHVALKTNDKQDLLELRSAELRLEKLFELMEAEIEVLKVEKKIRSRVKKQMERSQKEHYLNEQMQAIQRELGDAEQGGKSEIQEIEEKLNAKRMSKEAQAKVKKELKKLKLMGPMSAEAAVVRTYIDWVLALPWGEETVDLLDVDNAKKVLDADHFGLKKVKDRILEHLAVQQLVGQMRGPILCFVGPPGVGKTSLAKSIAKSLGRNFVRISLGGVRDEAEIRGHRRTYIGALPGRLIQSLKKAESCNPVILLDEIDKLSSDFRGDPSAALLEVLDPEQNNAFNDHYLDMDFDLSKVMFICTANSLHSIPQPLVDRMEVVRIAGYTEAEKLSIARRYLVPKQQEANGLKSHAVTLSTKAVKTLIRRYTRESGVRNLEREVASIFRKVARQRVALKSEPVEVALVTAKRVIKLLGTPRVPRDRIEKTDTIGMVNGLAWTEFGGEVLTTEATTMPGKGKIIVTGVLKEVMKESAQAAVTYVRTRAGRLGIEDSFFERNDIHIHFPGAFPKDGPSAGVTMVTALVSSIMRIPVRRDLAMTGEITLRGRVTAIGGLKEKCLAAHRLGIKTVLIPKENQKDLKDLPAKIREALSIRPVEFLDEVLAHALVREKETAVAVHTNDA